MKSLLEDDDYRRLKGILIVKYMKNRFFKLREYSKVSLIEYKSDLLMITLVAAQERPPSVTVGSI